MTEIRCEKCNKLLAKTTGEAIKESQSYTSHPDGKRSLEIKCPRCGEINSFDVHKILT